MNATYPKRLIEVDLPVKEISAQARREKSIRHGHISTLHIWWARRPLAACRAVLCAALWPDPADPHCPPSFVGTAARAMQAFRDRRGGRQRDWSSPEQVRAALLDFIAEFSNWDNSTNSDFLSTSRALTQAAHEALGGQRGTRPLVVDPFAGGGAIPLEALRVGADAFASDLNPVAVLLNKVVLEYIPKYGQKLADEVRKWGQWVKHQAEEELARFYPRDPDGAMPISYLWARTIRCEGPSCGSEVPLIRSLWLCKKSGRTVGLTLTPRKDRSGVSVSVVRNPKASEANSGTVRRGSATCPCCGYTTPVSAVRAQLKSRSGGATDARLLCVVLNKPGENGRYYRVPTAQDTDAVRQATEQLSRHSKRHSSVLSAIPDESTSEYATFVNRGSIYGMDTWGAFFAPRQALALTTLVRAVREAHQCMKSELGSGLAEAVVTCLALAVDRQADYNSSLCRWVPAGEFIGNTFGRQALPMVWDFNEVNVLSEATGGFQGAVQWVAKVCEANLLTSIRPGQVERATATSHPMPDDSAHAFITDPPYYFSVQYADLADFFYVWLRRTLFDVHPALLSTPLCQKDDEIIVQTPAHQFASDGKNNAYYENGMRRALEQGRRILAPTGIGTVVFAHTSTAGWESLLLALVSAGWTITASWPIDTEMGSRVIAQGRSVLASSVHLVCRPRENPDGSLRDTEVGDWREVLAELPKRIAEWMPRLRSEGIVGADAIFACLGPALEVFSRYARVEKASGEEVTLRAYLEQVWAAVSQEALNMVFQGADAASLEEDARLTAMWLWTLSTGNGKAGDADDEADSESDNDDSDGKKKSKGTGFTLEYDAARKIAQGLGAHLENLQTVVAIEKDTARLLPVAERTKALFGKDDSEAPTSRRKKSKQKQMAFQEELEQAEADGGWGKKGAPTLGETTLDRVHQAMILFAAGRSEAMKRFLVEEGAGRDGKFWTLAQALSALYPAGTDEKRWVDGVLARKKGLGF